MKKLLIILYLVFLSSYSYSKEVIPEGETGSKKGPPKAGTVTKKGPEGEMNRFDSSKGPQRVYKAVRESSHYNKKPYEKFYENGQLEQRRTYNNGEMDGLWESYYENGQLQLRGNYKNGKLDGPYETFHDNGQIKERLFYKDGMKEGLYFFQHFSPLFRFYIPNFITNIVD